MWFEPASMQQFEQDQRRFLWRKEVGEVIVLEVSKYVELNACKVQVILPVMSVKIRSR